MSRMNPLPQPSDIHAKPAPTTDEILIKALCTLSMSLAIRGIELAYVYEPVGESADAFLEAFFALEEVIASPTFRPDKETNEALDVLLRAVGGRDA